MRIDSFKARLHEVQCLCLPAVSWGMRLHRRIERAVQPIQTVRRSQSRPPFCVQYGEKRVEVKCQLFVQLSNAAGVVSCQLDMKTAVDILPFGMVIYLLNLARGLDHKSDGIGKTLEFKSSTQPVAGTLPSIHCPGGFVIFWHVSSHHLKLLNAS